MAVDGGCRTMFGACRRLGIRIPIVRLAVTFVYFLFLRVDCDVLPLSGFIWLRVSLQDVSVLFIFVHTVLFVLYVIFFAHILHQLQCTFFAFVITAH